MISGRRHGGGSLFIYKISHAVKPGEADGAMKGEANHEAKIIFAVAVR